MSNIIVKGDLDGNSAKQVSKSATLSSRLSCGPELQATRATTNTTNTTLTQ